VSLAHFGTSFIYMWINETDKIVLLFCMSKFFWKVSLNVFTQDKQHTGKKSETLIGLIAHLPIDNRWRSSFLF